MVFHAVWWYLNFFWNFPLSVCRFPQELNVGQVSAANMWALFAQHCSMFLKGKKKYTDVEISYKQHSECLRQYLYIGICVESSFKFVQCTYLDYVSVKQYRCRHYVDEMTYISYLCQIACTNLSAYVCF